jgi:methylated-DNA-protein-cysteine methyltransferase-like protein
MVSKAMSRSDTPLPWYRIVRSNRTLAFEVGSEPYKRQKDLLEQEGVQVINGKVIPLESDDSVDLDRFLWGPGK